MTGHATIREDPKPERTRYAGGFRLLRAAPPAVALLLLPYVFHGAETLSLLTTATIYAIITSGLGIVYGQIGLLAMSQPAVWLVGSYTAAILVTKEGMPLWTTLPLGIVTGFAAGGLTAFPAFRLRGHYLTITGFVLSQLFVAVAVLWQSFTGGALGLFVRGRFTGVLASFQHARPFYYLCAVILIIGLAYVALVKRSRRNLKFLAVRENQALSAAIGINVRNQIILGYALSGMFAGIGGVLYAISLQHIEPGLFGLEAVILMPLIVLVGGSRSLWGPTVGSFVIVFLPHVIHLSPENVVGLKGILLLLIILVMPEGIVGGLARIVGRAAARLRQPIAARGAG